MKQGCNYKQLTGYCQVRTAYCAVNRAFYVSCRDAFALKVGFSMTSRGVFGGWQASLTDTLRCVSHKIDERLPSVASHTGQQYLWRLASQPCQTRCGVCDAYLCNAASGLCKPVEVSQFLHNARSLCAMQQAKEHCA